VNIENLLYWGDCQYPSVNLEIAKPQGAGSDDVARGELPWNWATDGIEIAGIAEVQGWHGHRAEAGISSCRTGNLVPYFGCLPPDHHSLACDAWERLSNLKHALTEVEKVGMSGTVDIASRADRSGRTTQ
jgi:hypothetical protein